MPKAHAPIRPRSFPGVARGEHFAVRGFSVRPGTDPHPEMTYTDPMDKQWNIYLSGEIHTDWREEIMDGCAARQLPVTFTSAVTDHDASDAAGDVLGKPESAFWRDHQSSKINAIRIRTSITDCDVAIIRFGDKYKQWNAAFDAGYCAAIGKPYITLHDENLIHALKEVDGPALGWATTTDQVVEILEYVTTKG